MADWDWCTFVLLIVLAIVVITLIVGGTYAAMTYFRMVERYHQQGKHPGSKSHNYPPSSSFFSDGLPVGQVNHQQQHYSNPRLALPYWQHQEQNNPLHVSPYTSPASASNPHSQATPEQQQQAMAQYLQMMYFQQYMQQLMNASNEDQYEKQGRATK